MPPAAVLLESYLDLAPPREPSLDQLASPVHTSAPPSSTDSTAQTLEAEQLVPRNRYIDRPQELRPPALALAKRDGAVQPSLTASLDKRSSSLAPNYSQKVTLGVIAAYAVVISVLWITPVVKWILWPFKVHFLRAHFQRLHPRTEARLFARYPVCTLYAVHLRRIRIRVSSPQQAAKLDQSGDRY